MRPLLRLLLVLGSLAAALTTPLPAQQPTGIPFNGLITDISGRPIRNARIYVSKGRVARSDRRGRFGLTDVLPTDTIHVRFKRNKYDIPVEGRRSLRIIANDQFEASEDQELVNWGYGYVRKRESLEVANGISGADLARSGYTNVLEALQGRVPGLNITTSGLVGSTPHVSMRGINSIYADQTPLFVVDGTIVESIDWLSVYVVDHIEILKDATIYGARGANGAILITTKKG